MEEKPDSAQRLEDIANSRRNFNKKFNKFNKSNQFSEQNSPFNELDGEKIDPDEIASLIAEQRRGAQMSSNQFSKNKPYEQPDS